MPERGSPITDDKSFEVDFDKGDYSLINEYEKLKNTDEKLEYVRNILMQDNELPTDFALDMFSSLSDSLGSDGRHSQAVETFKMFYEKKRETYLDAFDFFDRMLLCHYIHLNDISGIEAILERFDTEPDEHIDNYVEVLTALECYGHIDLALSSYRRNWKKIVSSENIMGWAIDDFIDKLYILTFFEYLFIDTTSLKSKDAIFRQLLEYGEIKDQEEAVKEYQRTLDILSGKEQLKWHAEDFPPHNTGFKNLNYLTLDFIRWFKDKYGIHMLGLAENYRKEASNYLYFLNRGKKSRSIFRFSHEKLDEFLTRFFRFPSFDKYHGVIALEGVKEFFTFFDEYGLVKNDLVKEVEHSYRRLGKEIERLLGISAWRYSWREFQKKAEKNKM